MTALNGKKIFAPGRFSATAIVVNPTPFRPVLVQDQSITWKRETKSIFGENQMADDTCSGTMTCNGKVSVGGNSARLFSDLLFSDTGVLGLTTFTQGEAGTPSGSPPVITVVNGVNFGLDAGVVDVTTGNRMVRVASASEVLGVSYSLGAGGVYRFATGDTGAKKISYTWTSSSSGETITLTNQVQGKSGTFQGVMAFLWGSEQDVLTLNNCTLSDAEIMTKQSDYGKPTFAFEAACDTTGTLGTFSFAEAA